MKLSAEGKLRLAVQLVFVAGASGIAADALAQGAQPTELTGVQVTGSRIKQANLTNSSSLTIISDKELQYQGTTNVETLLNNMPQTYAGFSTGDSNGATGTATVDLRGLGSQETLVLIDGKRLMAGDPTFSPTAAPAPDLNFIPAALIDRIDILSGGASAVYGSDAVAGVVNFIMKKDFQGFRLDSQLSRTDHSDGTTYDSTLIWGNNFSGGKGNVTLYAGYQKMEAVNEGQRGWSTCSLATGPYGAPVRTYHYCGGSGTIPDNKITSVDRAHYNANTGKKINTQYINNPNGNAGLIPFRTPGTPTSFNFAPYNYLQRPDKRWRLGGFAHDQLNKHVDIYGSAMFMDDHTVGAIAPTGLFGSTVKVPCNSTFLSPADASNLCGGTFDTGGSTSPDFTNGTGVATLTMNKRLVELGPRESDLRHDQYRIQFGVRGDIIDGVSYDTSYQYGTVVYASGTLNYLNSTNAGKALNTIIGPALLPDGKTPNPFVGQTECASRYNGTDGNCVPLNLFQLGKITPQALSYIKANGFTQASTTQQVLTAAVNADLGKYGAKSPLAKNGVGVAAGYEYRSETLNYQPDSLVQAGSLGGGGGPIPPATGGFQVPEVFGEVQVPVIENMPGAKLLQIDGAYRWANYSTAKEAHTWKTGLKYQPINDVLLRASFARATRAPSITELFTPNHVGLISGTDPCGGPTPAATAAECALTGVSAAQYGNIPVCNSSQCNIGQGGNTALKPELSITRSLGVVLTPSFVKNLSITIDYYDIYIDHAIRDVPISALFQECVQSNSASSKPCAGFHRSANDGGLSGDTLTGAGSVDDIDVNTGSLRTKGVDFETDYRIRLRDMGLGNNGQFQFGYNATWVESFELENAPNNGVYNCAGMYGITCGAVSNGPIPRIRQKMRATWVSPFGLTLTANYRFIGGVHLDQNSADPHLNGNGTALIDIPDNHIGSKQYLDLSGTYALPIPGQNILLRFGVSNVGAQKPPTVDTNSIGISAPPFGNANTFPNYYDSLGRVMFVGMTADF